MRAQWETRKEGRKGAVRLEVVRLSARRARCPSSVEVDIAGEATEVQERVEHRARGHGASARHARAADRCARAAADRRQPTGRAANLPSRARAPHKRFWGSMVVVILRTDPSCLSVPMLLVILGVCCCAEQAVVPALGTASQSSRGAAIPRERVCVVGSVYRPIPPSLRRVAFFCFRGVWGQRRQRGRRVRAP